jgi:thiol-disulfide isomerase/thioredoxin
MTSLPSFGAANEWLNSPPRSPSALRGQVVLVNFWTLTCVNWLRQAPYVRAWDEAYRDDGLVVIGVHTPEFGFEHSADLVRRHAPGYPVAIDNDYGVWNAFDNHYWPALYFADRDGVIQDFHFGEGRYEESERVLQRLLGISREPVPVSGVGIEEAADWDALRTPETYLGQGRSSAFAGVHSGRDGYAFPPHLRFNQWALDGEWTVGPEFARLDQAGGSIAFHYQARDANLVLSAAVGKPIPFRVLLDGSAPGRDHGVDVSAEGDGVLEHGRLYQLVRQQGAVRERTLEVIFLEAGAQAYSFTFG